MNQDWYKMVINIIMAHPTLRGVRLESLRYYNLMVTNKYYIDTQT